MRVHKLYLTQTELFRPEVYGNHERLFLGCFDVLALKCSSDCASSVAGAIMHKSDRDQKSCQEIHAWVGGCESLVFTDYVPSWTAALDARDSFLRRCPSSKFARRANLARYSSKGVWFRSKFNHARVWGKGFSATCRSIWSSYAQQVEFRKFSSGDCVEALTVKCALAQNTSKALHRW